MLNSTDKGEYIKMPIILLRFIDNVFDQND